MLTHAPDMPAHEFWTVTAGDLATRRAEIATPAYTDDPGDAVRVVLDTAETHQTWIGAGAAITDSSAYLFCEAMDAEQRSAILTEMFDAAEGAFNMVRISIGACDFTSQPYYSLDDVPPGAADGDLRHFTIGDPDERTLDHKYVIPVLQEILAINPAVKVVASPWSPPAWMKTTGHFTHGGRLRFGEYVGNGYREQDKLESVFAAYFVRFIEAYAAIGIPIWGITLQNEPSNTPPWPVCVYTPQELLDLGADFVRPALDRSFPDTKMYFADDSFRFFAEHAVAGLDPAKARAFDGVAVHTYNGHIVDLHNVTRPFPDWQIAMTERRCMNDETVEEASHVMFGEIGNALTNLGQGWFTLWNMALDERGLPSIANTMGRRGVITIDSETGGVIRNLEYYLIRNFTQGVRAGARRVSSTNRCWDGYTGGLGSVCFLDADQTLSTILYNPTAEPITAAVVRQGASRAWQVVEVPAYGTVTAVQGFREPNRSAPGVDADFEIVHVEHEPDEVD